MDKCLENKTVVVTGGAQGIGLDIAKKFLQSGAKLAILLDINDDKGHAWYKKHGVRVISLCPGFTETNSFVADLTKGNIENNFVAIIESQKRQKVDAVGTAAVVVLERGSSGSVWVIEEGELKEEIL